MGGGDGPPTKWQGKCMVELVGITPDQVWPVLLDFCNGHEWFPSMHTCRKVEGDDGRPGLIRYCTGSRKSVMKQADGEGEEIVHTIKWAYERLTAVDPYERQVSYVVLENNIGLSSYLATMRVVPIMGIREDVASADGCKIEWTFECDPITGSWESANEYELFLELNLQAMARKLEGKFKVLAHICSE